MRKSILMVSLILIGSACALKSKTNTQGSSVPIDLVSEADESGRVFIDASFDGNQEHCYLDSGASFTTIRSNKTFDKYKSQGDKTFMGLSGKPVTASKIIVGEIRAGPFIKKDHTVVRYPNNPGFEPTIGIDFFDSERVAFLFKTRQLINDFNISLTDNFEKGTKGQIYLSVLLGDQTVKGIWDTGAGLTTVDSAFIDKNPNQFKFVKDVQGNDTVGSQIAMKLYRAKSLRVGSVSFNDIAVVSFDLSPIRTKMGDPSLSIILGYNAITLYDWYFDFENKKWTVR